MNKLHDSIKGGILLARYSPVQKDRNEYGGAALAVRDFLAQKFAVAYLEAGDDEKTLAILRKLWEEITK